jgi:YVTN family beta-propeller protein/VCBS repeat-containing protein
VSRISTANNQVVATTSVGWSPIAVNATNARVYVVNQYGNSVSVIDTANNQVVATPTVGPTPTSVALSRDGSLAYVANTDDTVSILNTKANNVVRTVAVDMAPESGVHSIAVSPDGSKIYVSDAADNSVRILTISRGNTAPTAGTPAVDIPDATTGAVSGKVNATDADGDTLSYSVIAQPARGSVTLNPATGSFTYTPTPAARQQAGQGGPTSDSFDVSVSDGNATTPVTVTVSITSSNHAPTLQGQPTVNPADLDSGTVTGSFTVADADSDILSYSIMQPSSGGVTVYGSPGPATTYTYNFVYTPSQAARDAAAQTPGADTDTFTVTLNDGTTSTNVTVTVPVESRPADMPNWQAPTIETKDPYSGRQTGHFNASDPNGDPLLYSVTYGPYYGTLDLNPSTGNFVYTPYLNADQGYESSEIITIAISDGKYTIYRDWYVDTYRDDIWGW